MTRDLLPLSAQSQPNENCRVIAPRGSFRYPYAVGYLNNDLTDGENDGFIAIAPSFVTIGTEGYNLSQLKVEGVDASTKESFVEIQMLDEDGVAQQYFDWWHGGSGKHKTDGWYEGNDLVDGDEYEVVFTKGQGLWMTAVAGARIVSSGEVLSENITVELQDGFAMVANPFPCTIGLSTIEILDVDASTKESFVEIQMLDSEGVAQQYFDWWHGGSGKHKTDGWYEGNDIVDGDEYEVEFFPGQALWITAVDGVKIKFNCPEFLAPAAE